MESVFSLVILGYFLMLIIASRFTTGHSDTQTYFTANKQSPWYLVAFGMIGASLSGITFISVPGEVGNSRLSYFQLTLGFVAGYLIISYVLIPIYYRLNVTSIYEYLNVRFGSKSNKTGAGLFLLSQSLGASLRLFVVTAILHKYAFSYFGIPFAVVALFVVFVIWFYTKNGGIKTLVWTDTIQTFLMLFVLIATIIVLVHTINNSGLNSHGLLAQHWSESTFIWEWHHPRNFFKQFFSGVFIAIVLTGLDQNLMQKHLTCKNAQEAQKNINSFSIVYLLVNVLFLNLGILLYAFAESEGITLSVDAMGHYMHSDDLYPNLAIHHLSVGIALLFILGLSAAALSSADSAVTSLTTSFCFDLLRVQDKSESHRISAKKYSHLAFSLLVCVIVMVFYHLKEDSAINLVYNLAGYTYGPILGLFAFGILTPKLITVDRLVPVICVLSPFISHGVKELIHSSTTYTVGFEFLLINGAVTWVLLYTTGWVTTKKSLINS